MSGTSRRAFLARSLALGVSAPALASMLASCTGDDDEGFGDEQTPEHVSDGTPFKGRIVVAPLQNPPKAAQLALTRAYRKHQPDVEIVWQTKDYSDSREYERWLNTQLSSNRIGPDIVTSTYAPDFRGYVNFDQYRAQENPYTGQDWEKDYQFALYRELNTRGQRNLLGSDGLHLLWYYNKEIFAQAKVSPPTTWNAVIDVCKKLKAAGHVPLSTNFDYILPGWISSIYFDQYHTAWASATRAQPGDWNWNSDLDGDFDYDANDPLLHAKYTYSPQRFYQALKDQTLRFDTPAMVELITNVIRVFPQYSNGDFFAYTDQYLPFLQGEAAMLVDGSWSLTLLAKDMEGLTPARAKKLGVQQKPVRKFEWDIFEFPAMEGPLVQSRPRSPEGTTGYYLSVVDKDRSHTAMVMDFLMFWMSKPGYSEFLRGTAAANELAPAGPPMVNGIQYPKDVQDLLGKFQQKGVIGPSYGSFWVNGAGGRSTQAFQGLFTDVLQRRIDPQEYATNLQKSLENNFADILRTEGLTEDEVANPARRPGSV